MSEIYVIYLPVQTNNRKLAAVPYYIRSVTAILPVNKYVRVATDAKANCSKVGCGSTDDCSTPECTVKMFCIL